MRISEKRKNALNTCLDALNNTVGKNIDVINRAFKNCTKVLGKSLELEFDDSTNLWYYITLGGKRLNENFDIIK